MNRGMNKIMEKGVNVSVNNPSYTLLFMGKKELGHRIPGSTNRDKD